MSALRRARGSLVVIRTLRRQGRIPYLPEERLLALRDRRVRETVTYAVRTVPHYRALFEELDLRPGDVTSAEDFTRLPLLDKDAVQDDPRRFVARSASGDRALRFQTTGTTGMPVEIFHDERSLLQNIAYGERERAVETSLLGSTGSTVLHVDHAAATTRRILTFYGEAAFRPGRPNRRFVSVDQPVEQIVAAINDVRPDVLRGYGAFLETLFRVADARGLPLRAPRLLIYAGDGMSPEGRRFIETRFGTRVRSQYNAVEALKIGFMCEEGDGFHLHSDLCHVAVVGPRGVPLAPGERGEIVISNLVNRATVLLNYRIGDIGRLALDRCRCGRTGPRLAELEGRVDEILLLADGRLVTPIAVWSAVRATEGILRYQLVQREPERFELKLVTVDEQAFERIASRVVDALAPVLGNARIDATRHDELGAGAKFRPIVPLALG